MVLIMLQARRLLTDIAGRHWVLGVALDLLKSAFTIRADGYSAITRTQNAGRVVIDKFLCGHSYL